MAYQRHWQTHCVSMCSWATSQVISDSWWVVIQERVPPGFPRLPALCSNLCLKHSSHDSCSFSFPQGKVHTFNLASSPLQSVQSPLQSLLHHMNPPLQSKLPVDFGLSDPMSSLLSPPYLKPEIKPCPLWEATSNCHDTAQRQPHFLLALTVSQFHELGMLPYAVI